MRMMAVVQARKVLVIDDQRVVCSSCRKVLEQEGYKVSVATDPREGIERASRENFDAVIIDLRMPGLDGIEVLRVIKENNPKTKVLVMTAYSSIATAVEVMQLGASDYLPKPFTPKELIERMERLFQGEKPPDLSRREEGVASGEVSAAPKDEGVEEGRVRSRGGHR